MQQLLTKWSETFYEDGVVQILGHRATKDGLIIHVRLADDYDPEVAFDYDVTCREVLEFRLQSVSGNFVILDRAHLVARQFSSLHADLLFTGECEGADAAVGRLLQAHRDVAEDWIEWERYLNLLQPLSELLGGGHGKLATGPVWLLDAYENALLESGLTTYRLREHQYRRWNDGRWVEPPEDLATLILGKSYVVAGSFQVTER